MRKTILSLLLLIIALGAWRLYQPKTLSDTESNIQGVEFEIETVDFKIDYGDGRVNQFSEIKIEEEMSALDVLEKVARENGFVIMVEETSFGPFVQAIGKKQGDKQRFWAFWVNDEMSEVGAGEYLIQAGDRIGFKYSALKY